MTTQTKTIWRKVGLGEVVEIIDGDRGENYPGNGELLRSGYSVFLNTKNVSGTKFDFNNVQFISKERDSLLRKGKLERGDFILTTRGTIGNIAYYGNDVQYDHIRINLGMVILRPKRHIIDVRFLNIFFAGQEFKNQIEFLQSGSAQPQLPIRDLRLCEIKLPSLDEQVKISDILWPFDDKIENNNKIIKTLEEMAEALFKEWFVKFRFPHLRQGFGGQAGHEKTEFIDSALGKIPKGWEVGKLGDVLELAYGKALKAEDRIVGDILVIGSSGVVGAHNKKLVSGPGIVIGRKGTIGSVIWVHSDFYPIDTTFYVVSDLSLPYCFFLLKKQKFVTGDSAVPGLGREVAYMNIVLRPNNDTMKDFDDLVYPMFNQKSILEKENQKLALFRDLLLPKLMSGEIIV